MQLGHRIRSLPNPFASKSVRFQILSLPNPFASKSVRFQILSLPNPFSSKSVNFKIYFLLVKIQRLSSCVITVIVHARRLTACALQYLLQPHSSTTTTPHRHLSPLHTVAQLHAVARRNEHTGLTSASWLAVSKNVHGTREVIIMTN